VAEATDAVDVVTAVRAVSARLSDEAFLSAQSLSRFVDLIEQFSRHLERAQGVGELQAVTPDLAAGFIDSEAVGGAPTLSVRHFRRTAVRLLFRVARDLGLADGDPTLDITLAPRPRGAFRALTDDEVALCRLASVASLEETRLPAAWALAEATARTSELNAITGADVDLQRGRVWLRGGTFTDPRWGELSDWGYVWVERRMHALGDRARPLTYDGHGSAQSRQAAACLSISSTLARAGLTGEPDLRPLSVTAWAGRQIFEETGQIEVAARALGMRSLDRTARLIGFDWRTAMGPGDR